jgi:hypothetical protein
MAGNSAVTGSVTSLLPGRITLGQIDVVDDGTVAQPEAK